MLKFISWGDYFSTLTFLLIVYYIAVGYFYFRYELLGLVGIVKYQSDGGNISVANFEGSTFPEEENNQANSSNDIDITPVVQGFLLEVSSYLEQAKTENAAKQEVLYALQKISARYPVLANSDYKATLASDVQDIISQHFSGVFTADEIKPYLFG